MSDKINLVEYIHSLSPTSGPALDVLASKEIGIARRLDPNGPIDLLTGVGMESDADFRARLAAHFKAMAR